MKRTCTLMFLFIMAFLLGNTMVKAQPAEVWNITPDWNTGKDKRGIAYNVLTNHVYVAGTAGGADQAADPALNQIHVLDAADGTVLDTLTLEPLAINSNGYGIRDVAVSSDGGIFATITTTNAFNPQKIYYWENEDANPMLLWDDQSGNDIDFGPGFDVYGDITDEALIIIPFFEEAKVYYFEVVGGVVSDPVTLDLTGVVAGRNSTVQALGTKITDGFWYNNATLNQPTLINGTGAVTGAIPAGIFSGQTHDVEQFSVGSMTYLAVGEDSVVQIIDITGKAADFSDVTTADSVTEITGKPAIPAGWPPEYGLGQELETMGLPDGSFVVYSLSGDNYIKANATEGAPFASNLMIMGAPLTGEVITLDYTYVDINGDPEGNSEVKWYIADDASGTNKTEIAANAGNLDYTIDAADAGKYITFTVLAASSSGTASDPSHLMESEPFGPVLTEADPPVASDVAVSGSLDVGSELTGSYTYSDPNGDPEGESIFRWYRADDDQGTNAMLVASGSATYTVDPEDAGKYMIFNVIPVAASGYLVTGDSVAAATTATINFPPLPPTASEVTITGREEVAGILTGTYTYTDLNEDPEGNTILKWYSADAVDGTKTEVAADTNRYELAAADEGKYIFFGVTPVTEAGETGDEVLDTTGVIGPEPAPEAPVATDVMAHGIPEVGAVVYGTYTYTDRTDDPEGESIIKWYTADDTLGTNMVEIADANAYTLLVTEDMIGKYLAFEITPVATVGELLEGEPDTAIIKVAAMESTNDGDFERVWLRASKLEGTPEYLSSASTERGFAVGNGDHMYVASRKGGTKLLIVDKNNGALVGEMNTEGMDVGLFRISDVEVSDDGQILACPLQINASAEPFVIYKWENELSAPTKFIEFTATEAMRLGDKFTVVGDVSGDAVIYAATSGGNKVIRWVVTGGIVDAGTVITLENTTSIGSTPAVAPFDATPTSSFIVDGRGFQAQIFDHEGMFVSAIEGVGQSNNQSNSPNIFYFKERRMAAFHQKNEAGEWNAIVMDITSVPHILVGTSEVLSTANQELGGVHVETTEEYFKLYMLSANNGLAQWQGTLELPVFEYAETNLEGTEIYVRFSKNMPDSIGNTTGWTIMGDTEMLGIDTIYGTGTEANILTFVLETAVTEGQAVTIAYDGSGTVTAFDGTPLNPFVAEAVVNIVGAEAPVASDVTITGEVRVGEILTGSYTYSDANGDLEEGSQYQWYYASDAEGSDMLKLLGENDITYTVTEDVSGMYVAFEVIPVTTTGGEDFLVGDPAMSDWVYIIPVGIEDEFANAVRFYPNPVADVLTIDNCSEVSTVTLIDLSGKVMKSVDNNGNSTMSINMASYQKGMYIIKLTGENGDTRIERVVKTK